MKKTFILHVDSLSILDEMTNEQKGILFDAIYKYQLGELVELDFAMKMAFAPFKNQFIRDDESYNNVVERNRLNGKNGGRPKKDNPKNPVGFIETQKTESNPKNLDNDNDSKSDNDSDNKSKNDSKKRNNTFTPPTLLEVENYFFENGYKREAGTKAYNYYSVANWQDSKGSRVKNWKQKMQAVWFKDEHRILVIQPSRQQTVNYGRYVID